MVHIMLTGNRADRGFTLIELLVVLAIISMLSALVIPVITSSLSGSKEAALKHNLMVLRKAIDEYLDDKDEYPAELGSLVTGKYIRYIPKDPLTGRADTWLPVYGEGEIRGICDVKSGAEGADENGEYYRDW